MYIYAYEYGGPAHTAELTACLIRDNQATGGGASGTGAAGGTAFGGGVYAYAGLLASGVTWSGNQSAGGAASAGGPAWGGGAWVSGQPAYCRVVNSTLSGNTALGGASSGSPGGSAWGGGLGGAGNVSNTTVADNAAVGGTGTTPGSANGGGVIYQVAGYYNSEFDLTSSIVAGNNANAQSNDLAPAPNSSTSWYDGGGNVIGPIDAKLGPLQNNGGPVPTRALLGGSPAIEAGVNSLGLATDSRGSGFPRTVGTRPDVGAVESSYNPPGVSMVPVADVTTSTPSFALTVTYSSTSGIDISTIGQGDLQVTGPNGFFVLPTLLGLDDASNGSPRTASYKLTGPGGSWDKVDAGTYTITLRPSEVSDTAGLYASGTPLATFRVRVSQNFVVTTTADSGTGSLREAISLANNSTNTPDTISFAPAVFNVARTIMTGSELPTVTDAITIQGPGAGFLTISGGVHQLFVIDSSLDPGVTFEGMTLSNGVGGGDYSLGGAIENNYTPLLMTACRLAANSALNDGGAIYSRGSVTMADCTVTGNTAGRSGGAIEALGPISILGGQFLNNSAGTYGGAIDGRIVTVRNTVFAGNTAKITGGAVRSNSTATISNSTFVGNSAAQSGGAVDVSLGRQFIITSSVLSGNRASTASDLSGPYDPGFITNSLIGSTDGYLMADGSGGNLLAGTDPLIAPISGRFIPLPGSPLIDAGSNPADLLTDGTGGPRVVGAAADIGAIEGPAVNPVAAQVRFADIRQSGGTAQTFTVNYGATDGIRISTVGTGDLRVTGPNGFTATPTFVSVDTATDGIARAATYTFTPPGGSWDGADDGSYTVSLVANEVQSLNNTYAPAGVIGSLAVLIPQTLVVTTTAASGAGSLADAVARANAIAGTFDTITFSPTVFATPQTITLAGTLTLTDSVRITGPGADKLAVSGGKAVRILSIDSVFKSSVTVAGLTLRDGRSSGSNIYAQAGAAVATYSADLTLRDCVLSGNGGTGRGGAVAFGGTGSLVVERCLFAGNTARGGDGGALSRVGVGPTILRQSTFQQNGQALPNETSVTDSGGAVRIDYGTVTIDGCTFASNAATGSGGGVYVVLPQQSTVLNSTFTENSAKSRSGGLSIYAGSNATLLLQNSTFSGNSNGGVAINVNSTSVVPLAVQNCTIVGNTLPNATAQSPGQGAGLYVSGPVLTRIDSSVIANSPNSTDVSAGSATVTNSAISTYAGFTLAPGSGGNLAAGTNLKLGTLANNGGPTQTILPLAGSPLIDAGSNPAGLATDGRGTPYVRTFGTATDIGAVEVQNPFTTASARVNDGSTARSRVTSLTVTFSTPVTLSPDAFTLTNQGGTTVPLTVDLSGSTASQTVAKLTFSGSSLDAGSLANGRSTLRVGAAQVTAPLGFDGDGDNQAGGDYTMSLFRLAGDANGSGAVDAQDVTAFLNTYGTSQGNAAYRADLDLNASGAVDAQDVTLFLNVYGMTLP